MGNLESSAFSGLLFAKFHGIIQIITLKSLNLCVFLKRLINIIRILYIELDIVEFLLTQGLIINIDAFNIIHKNPLNYSIY